jgi:hypothetical protein
MREKKIINELQKYEGDYKVFHWRDHNTQDGCNYRINIKLDKKNAVFNISQTGNEDSHELVAKIKIEELGYSFGDGNYSHPKRANKEGGRMQIFLIGDGVINVDKTYLCLKGESVFSQEWEKWRWEKMK